MKIDDLTEVEFADFPKEVVERIAHVKEAYLTALIKKPGACIGIQRIFTEQNVGRGDTVNYLTAIGGAERMAEYFKWKPVGMSAVYENTVAEVNRRLEGGLIGDKELIELFKMVSGLAVEKEPSVQVNVVNSIDEYLAKQNG